MLGFFMMFWSANLGFDGSFQISIKQRGIYLGRKQGINKIDYDLF